MIPSNLFLKSSSSCLVFTEYNSWRDIALFFCIFFKLNRWKVFSALNMFRYFNSWPLCLTAMWLVRSPFDTQILSCKERLHDSFLSEGITSLLCDISESLSATAPLKSSSNRKFQFPSLIWRKLIENWLLYQNSPNAANFSILLFLMATDVLSM